MYKRVAKYLDKHNMLFQKKHSTNLATIELVTKILHAMDNTEYNWSNFSPYKGVWHSKPSELHNKQKIDD